MGINDTGFNDTVISDDNLNQTVLFRRSSLPTADFPVGALLFLTTTGEIYENTGTYATPVWTLHVLNVPADSQFAPTTKDDGTTAISVTDTEFTTPTAASASSTNVTPAGASDFSDDFNTNAGWTQVGTLVTVDDASFPDVLRFDNATQTADRRVHKSLGITLDNTKWIADFKFKVFSVSANGNVAVFGFFSSAVDPTDPTNVDMLVFGFGLQNGTWAVCYIGYKDGTGSKTYSSYIILTTNVQYYCRLARTSATNLRLYVWKNNWGGELVGTLNLSIPSGVQNLSMLQATTRGTDGSAGVFTAEFDDLVVYNAEDIPTFEADSIKDSKSNPTALRQKTQSEVNPWVVADMNTAQELLGVAIHFHADTNISKFKIETSTNGTNWLRRKTVPYSLITANQWNIILFPRPPALARYVRIMGLDATNKIVSINEVAVLVLTESVINRRHRHIAYDPNSECKTLTGA